jgi:acetyltransferase EpsM
MAAAEAPAEGTDRGRVTSRRLVILGGGEHARVVAEAAMAGGWEVVGYTDSGDSAPSDRSPGDSAPGGSAADRAMPVPRLGTDAEVAAGVGDVGGTGGAFVLGFGGPFAARRRAVAAFPRDAEWAIVIHPRAWVSPTATVEPGTVVLGGVVVNAGARVGPHAIVNSGAIVEHDVVVGAHAHVAPGAVIGGGATIGEEAFVGLGAAVRDHRSVGRGAIIGMGAVVVGDVPAGATVAGIPARPRASSQDPEPDRG